MRRSKESYRIRLRDVRFYDNLLGKIVKIGLPTGVQNIVISLSNVVVQSGVNSFGATVMAVSYTHLDVYKRQPNFGLYVVKDNRMPAEVMYSNASVAAKEGAGNYLKYFTYYTDEMDARCV